VKHLASSFSRAWTLRCGFSKNSRGVIWYAATLASSSGLGFRGRAPEPPSSYLPRAAFLVSVWLCPTGRGLPVQSCLMAFLNHLYKNERFDSPRSRADWPDRFSIHRLGCTAPDLLGDIDHKRKLPPLLIRRNLVAVNGTRKAALWTKRELLEGHEPRCRIDSPL
jgi:hypothetical protein